MAILEVNDVTSGYGDVQILWGASLKLEPGLMTCLVGANGVGKTTLLRTVMGQLRPWSGSVRFEGHEISRLPAHRRAELGLVLVPEGRQLFGDMTVRENLDLGATNRRAHRYRERNLERVFAMFPRLKHRSTQKANTMSGGEQQMLAVGRGIMAEPTVLLIDELSLGLAPVLVIQLFENLQSLKDLGITIMLVEQNVQMSLAVCDYGYVLAQGRIEIEGESAALIKDDHVRAAYMGL
ncbi:MAG: ABC transporter ATP-binding protein [Chloroflexales bacterium]